MDASQLADRVDLFANFILDYALVLAAVATIVVALIELAKALFRLRLRYHRHRVAKWVHDSWAHEELLVLAVSGVDNANALFDQPTEKMMGQIQAAATVALDFPHRYTKLYGFLTSSPAAAEIAEAEKPDVESTETDQRLWLEFMKELERGDVTAASEPSPRTAEDDPRTAAASRARARLEHFVARKLDAFQTSAEYTWARLNQVVAVPAGAAFLLFLFRDEFAANPSGVLVGSLFGGMLAPFAKDIVAALSDLRTRRT